MQSTFKTSIIVSILLLLVSTYSIYNMLLEMSRALRLTTASIFFILFLINRGYKYPKLLFAFTCLVLSDAFMLFYENVLLNKLTSLITILGYIALISHVAKRVQMKNLNKSIVSFFIILILVNVYKLHNIIYTIEYVLLDQVQETLLYIYGMALICMCTLSVNYNFKDNTKKSMYFLLAAFSFVLSDLFAFTGYYHKIYSVYYIDRLFYILALYFIVRYTFQLSQKEEKSLALDV